MTTYPGYTGRRVHLGVTGSVAAYKSCELVRGLLAQGASVSATLTGAGARYVTPLTFEALGAAPVYAGMYDSIDLYGHLEPAQNADVLLVAPATANTIAKLANGIADDMLSAQALAFMGEGGPVVVAPAMNPRMWTTAATRQNVQTLCGRGVYFVGPDSGTVACGEEGSGKLSPVQDILDATLRALGPGDLQGKRVLVTLGPTRERWDSVRFWSNPSTGIMGGAVATAAWLRGAEVVAVCGPCNVRLPRGVWRVDVEDARSMYDATMQHANEADIIVATAAVADFHPLAHEGGKFKKEGRDSLTVEFDPNPDILAELGRMKHSGQVLVGFAAETGELEANARGKLSRKNLDLIVGNRVDVDGSGFGTATNAVLVIGADGQVDDWPTTAKTEIAWRLWDRISRT